LVLAQAQVTLASARGTRTVSVTDLTIAADELMLAVHLPKPEGDRSGYASIRRVALGPALTAVAMTLTPAGWLVAVRAGGVAVQRLGPCTAAVLPALLEAEVTAIADAHAGARYRAAMVQVLTRRLATRLADDAPAG